MPTNKKMSQHIVLTNAISLAKEHYQVWKKEATARAHPPGGQNVNNRILQRCIKQVEDVWRNYYEAAQ